MRRIVASFIAVAAVAATVAAVSSSAASANATRCRHAPSVLGYPTYENCIFLPVDPEDLIR